MKIKIIGIFVCTLLLFTTLTSGTATTINQNNKNSNNGVSKLMLLRINITQSINTLPPAVEIVSEKPGEWIDIIISDDELNELTDYNYEVIISDVIEYDNKVRADYHTLAEIENNLTEIANNYPNITNLTIIGTTYENRDILCLEITDNPKVNEGEPGIVFTGLHHAREWPSAEICLYIANQLTSQYGSDPSITDIVNNRRLWIIPCVNPDGYHWDHDLGNDWRKNRQPYGSSIGVDPNRNYDGSCDGNMRGTWGTINSIWTSHDPDNEHYCGPSPFSEYETQAVANIFLDYDICASINWHTHGERVLWPWGYTSDGQTPDNLYLKSIGEQIAGKIRTQDESYTYTPEQSGDFYRNTGGLSDWSYGYGHYVQGRPTFSYTIEACSSFHPDESYLDQICRENFDGTFFLLQVAENINNVTSRVIPPVIDDMTYDSDGNYIVSWEEQNPEANPVRFQLDELTNLSYSIDDAESDKRGLIWSYTTGDKVYSSPAFADGKVYVGSHDNKVYCLDAYNGNHIWSYTTGDPIWWSSPTVADDKVYIGSNDNKIYCLNADNGNFIWSYTTGDDVWSSPAVADGKVYIGSWDKKVYCLDADNGSFIWSYSTGDIVISSPAVSEGNVYIGSNDDNLYCLNAENGSHIWSYKIINLGLSSPAVADCKVYIGSRYDDMYCLDANTGDYIWSYMTGDDVDSSPAIADGKVYIGSWDDNLYCLNANTGDYIWSYNTGGAVVSSPAVANGKVYIGSWDNKVYCLNADDGSYIWSYSTGDDVRSSPAVSDGKVYIGSWDNKVYCLSTESLWSFDGFVISKTVSHSGDYCFCSQRTTPGVSSMRTTYPIPVTKDMELSFWCDYSINNWDFAFIEVSKDGRCYDIIDSFSKSSNGWIYKTYNIDSYEGESIFIRFRYTTDILLWGTGFFVDDIMLADFDKVTILSDSITSNQYNINGRPPGVYFYRLRGFNNERGWGDFSTLESIYVATTPPNKPRIDGPTSGKPRIKYEYSFSAEDPENHKVSYFINWGDDTSYGWTDFVESGTEIKLKHTWAFDITEEYFPFYTICAKAKDIYGVESNWETLEVIIPRNKPFISNFNIFSWFLERFPLLERLLTLIRMI